MDEKIRQIIRICLGPISASIFTFLPQTKIFTAQYIALLSIITLTISIKQNRLSLTALSFLVTGLVFSTGGLNSPVFFLIYFYIFTLAAQTSPSAALSFALILTLFLINSLDSPQSVLTLISLPFISPLAHYIGSLYQDNLHKQTQIEIDNDQIYHHETKFFLWFSLNLKPHLLSIIDSASQLLSSPGTNYHHRQLIKSIKNQTKTILKSAQSLAKDIDQKTDE